MGDLGARLLAKALYINNKLRTIHWDSNNIMAQGFTDVSHALTKCVNGVVSSAFVCFNQTGNRCKLCDDQIVQYHIAMLSGILPFNRCLLLYWIYTWPYDLTARKQKKPSTAYVAIH